MTAAPSMRRSTLIPELPTLDEAGVTGFDMDSWAGIFAPADTPADIVMLLNSELRMTRAGTPCQSPAIRGRRRCRLHGGLSPGAPKGSQNGNYKNGEWTAEAIEERKWLRDLVRSLGKPGQLHG
jgi:Tripartite tricarboxylate transporter family receptor